MVSSRHTILPQQYLFQNSLRPPSQPTKLRASHQRIPTLSLGMMNGRRRCPCTQDKHGRNLPRPDPIATLHARVRQSHVHPFHVRHRLPVWFCRDSQVTVGSTTSDGGPSLVTITIMEPAIIWILRVSAQEVKIAFPTQSVVPGLNQHPIRPLLSFNPTVRETENR